MRNNLFLLTSIGILCALLTFGILPRSTGSNSVDVQLYDTYFVFGSTTFFATLFTFSAGLIYLLKIVLGRPTRPTQQTAIGINALVIIVLTATVKMTTHIEEGTVVYPPLNALPNQELPTSLLTHLSLILQISQLVATGSLIWLCVRVGKRPAV